jgi:hypothetical protein
MSKVDVVDLGGVRMAHRENGDPKKPPALLLHGLGSESGVWDTVAAGLADVLHVYALDLRGHGRTSAPHRYSFELMRDDVLRFVDVVGLVARRKHGDLPDARARRRPHEPRPAGSAGRARGGVAGRPARRDPRRAPHPRARARGDDRRRRDVPRPVAGTVTGSRNIGIAVLVGRT